MSKNAALPEDLVKARLRQFLPLHFHLREEVWSDRQTRIDFWCFPKPAMLALGWDAQPFGIEAKGGELEDHRKRTAIRLVYQAIHYATSRFQGLDGNLLQPSFVLIYPKVSVLLGLGEEIERQESLMHGLEYGLVRLAAMFRVGELILDGSQFQVNFNGVRYFDSRRGKAAASPLAARSSYASR